MLIKKIWNHQITVGDCFVCSAINAMLGAAVCVGLVKLSESKRKTDDEEDLEESEAVEVEES